MIGSVFDVFLRVSESKELPGIEANARTEADVKNFFLFIEISDHVYSCLHLDLKNEGSLLIYLG